MYTPELTVHLHDPSAKWPHTLLQHEERIEPSTEESTPDLNPVVFGPHLPPTQVPIPSLTSINETNRT